jgi:hypothetical protein
LIASSIFLCFNVKLDRNLNFNTTFWTKNSSKASTISVLFHSEIFYLPNPDSTLIHTLWSMNFKTGKAERIGPTRYNIWALVFLVTSGKGRKCNRSCEASGSNEVFLEQHKKTLVFCYGWNLVSRSLFFMAFKTYILFFAHPKCTGRWKKNLTLRSIRLMNR